MNDINWQELSRRLGEENISLHKNIGHRELIGTSQTVEDLHRSVKQILQQEDIRFDSLAFVRSVTPPSGKPDLIQILEADGVYDDCRGEVFKSDMSLSGLAMMTNKPQYAPVVMAHPRIVLPEGVGGDASEYALPLRHDSQARPFKGAVLLRQERTNGFLEKDLTDAKNTLGELATPLGLVLSNFESMYDPMCRTIYSGGYLPHAITRDFDASRKRRVAYAAIFIDLDDFKAINDTYGHLGADDILYAIGEVLRAGMRERDVVGRHSGDQFLIGVRSMDEEHIHERVRAMRAKMHDLGNTLVADTIGLREGTTVNFSAGVAIYDPPKSSDDRKQARSVYDLIDAADTAVYQAKREGKGTTVVTHVA